MINIWLSDNFIEIFGAITGIIYVFLEIRQAIWLWPLGIITSGVYIWVFFTSKLYADMSLQGYYLVISFLGWYWWIKGTGQREEGRGQKKHTAEHEAVVKEDLETTEKRGMGELEKLVRGGLKVTRIGFRLIVILSLIFIGLFSAMYLILSRLTDSPVPGLDAFLTSLSIIATWMLARKIYEHWYLWIVVNLISMMLFYTRGLYPTVILYFVYLVMSFAGLKEWKRTLVPW
jgi:nicotinamide mononucleotide transporter